jgi:hypothetical protein
VSKSKAKKIAATARKGGITKPKAQRVGTKRYSVEVQRAYSETEDCIEGVIDLTV